MSKILNILPGRRPKRDDNGNSILQQPTPSGSFVHLPDTIDPHHQPIMRGSHRVTEEPKIVNAKDLGSDDIVIAVMGPTGSGKSTFICIASGRDNKAIGHKLRSFTGEVSTVRFWDQESGRHIVLVDTPGFDDTYKSDLDILTLISGWLVTSYNHRKLLSGILYLHRITDNRVAGSSLKNLRLFQKLCGKDALDKVYLTTTMWDEVELRVGERRLDELKTEYWKTMINQGARIARCRSDDESPKKLVRKIILSELGGISSFQPPLVETRQGPSSEKTLRHEVPRGGTLAPETLYERGGSSLRQPPLIETRHGPSHLQEKPRRYDVPLAGTFAPEVATPMSEQGGSPPRQPPLIETRQGSSSHLQEKPRRYDAPWGGTLAPEQILYEQGRPSLRQPPLTETRHGPSHLQEKSRRHDVPWAGTFAPEVATPMFEQGGSPPYQPLPIETRQGSSSHLQEKPRRYDAPWGGTLPPEVLFEQSGASPRQPPLVETRHGPSHFQEKTRRHEVPRGGTLAPEILPEQGPSPRHSPLIETRQGPSHFPERTRRHEVPWGGTLAPEILPEQGRPPPRQPPLVETRHGPSQEKTRRYDVPRGGTLAPEILSEQGGPSPRDPRRPPFIETRQGPSSHLQEKSRRHNAPREGILAPEAPPLEYRQNSSSHSPQTPQRHDVAYGGAPIPRSSAENSRSPTSHLPRNPQRRDGAYGGPRPPVKNSQGPSVHSPQNPSRRDLAHGGTPIHQPSAEHSQGSSSQSSNIDNILADALRRLNVSGKNAEPHGKPLLIQEEMVELKKGLKETAAGQQLYSQLETLVEKRVVLLRQIEKEKKASSDREIVRELQREYDDLRAQVDDRLRQMQQLKLPPLKRFFSLRRA